MHWPQSAIRRAADAMRESGSRDWLTLARTALQAGVRTEGDLLAILDGAPMIAATSALPRRADIGGVAPLANDGTAPQAGSTSKLQYL